MAKREMNTNVDEQTPVINEQTPVINEQIPVINEQTPVEEPKREEALVYVITGCSKLRIRKKPDANAEIVCLVDTTNELTVKEVEGKKDWVRVTTDSGKKGFCMKRFVTIK